MEATLLSGLPGSSRSGEKARWKSTPAFFPGTRFQDLAQLAVRGAGVGGGFQDDDRAVLDERGDGLAGFEHVAEIRFAEMVQRGRHAEDHRVRLGD